MPAPIQAAGSPWARIACLIACAVACTVATAAAEAADTVFHNGKIATMDPAFAIVSALAVEDGRILAVGSDAEVRALADENTVLVDLEGKTLLPGLIDSHMHPDQAAVSEFEHPIPDMVDVADVMAYVRARAEVLPEGEWIWVRTVFPPRLRERRFPTRAELDSAAPRHPVVFAPWIFYPKASMNSTALERLGIDRDADEQFATDIDRNADEQSATDIERDTSTGEPTGLVRNHTRYVEDTGVVDRTDEAQRAAQFRHLMTVYNAAGLTTVSDRKATPEMTSLYAALAAQNALTVRLSLMHLVDTAAGRDLDSIIADIAEIGRLREQINGSMLQLIGVKTFLDGGITSGTAYMHEPWGENELFAISDSAYRGNLNLSGDRLEQLIRAAADAGLQFTGHVVGDAAVTELVRAYGAVSDSSPLRPLRPSLTHANFITPSAIARMAELGVVADVQPAWLYLDSHNLLAHFGERRLQHFQPLRSLFAAGVVVAGGSDHWHRLDGHTATNPFNPFLGMWITLTRRPRNVEGVLNGDEALDREQALRLYTTNAAYVLFREADIGSLEPGKQADMIIVDRDVLEVNVDDIRDTRVLGTYVGGRLVYDAEHSR